MARPEFDEYENEANVRCLALTTTTSRVWLALCSLSPPCISSLRPLLVEGDDIDAGEHPNGELAFRCTQCVLCIERDGGQALRPMWLSRPAKREVEVQKLHGAAQR